MAFHQGLAFIHVLLIRSSPVTRQIVNRHLHDFTVLKTLSKCKPVS